MTLLADIMPSFVQSPEFEEYKAKFSAKDQALLESPTSGEHRLALAVH